MDNPLIRRIISLTIKGGSIVVTFLVAKLYISNADAGQYGKYILNHGYLLTAGTLAGMGQGLLVIRKLSSVSTADLGVIARGYFNVIANAVLIIALGALLIPIFNAGYVTFHKALAFFLYALSLFNFELVRLWSSGNMYILFKDILRTLLLMIVLLVEPFTDIDWVLTLTSVGMATGSSLFLVYQVATRETVIQKITWADTLIDMKAGWSISLGSGLQVFKGWVEVFLAGAFLSEAVVGLYSLLLRLGKLVSLPLVALNADIARQLALLAENGRYDKELQQHVRITRYFGVLFGLGAILVAPLFINFYGFDYDMYSLLAAGILIVGNTVNVLFGPVGFLAQLGSMRSVFNAITLLSILIVSVFTVLLVSELGIVALSIASLIAGICWNIVLSSRMKKVVGFRF